jgi:hypothetical protein
VIFYLLFAALPLCVLAWHAVDLRVDAARAAAVDRIERLVGERVRSLDDRLATAQRELDLLVTNGLARLSSESILDRPGLGIVEARMRSPASILPITTPFTRLELLDERGQSHWRAGQPATRDGSILFLEVDSRTVPGDTLGLAAVVLAGEEIVVGRGEPAELWLARTFRPDPHDRLFVARAAVPLSELVGDLALPAAATRLVVFDTESGLAIGNGEPGAASEQLGLAAPLPASPSVVGHWPGERAVAMRTDRRTGLGVAGMLELSAAYVPVRRAAIRTLMFTGAVIFVGLVVLVVACGRRTPVGAR